MATQPGVFNVTDSAWGLSTTNLPATNRNLLQTMVETLLDSTGPTGGNGGTIEFPAVGTFPFSGAPIVIGKNLSGVTEAYSIIIQGDGQGSEAAPLLQKTDTGDLFQINNTVSSDGYDHVGGITFRDLQIEYSEGTTGAAIHVVNGYNVRVLHCVFQDCPVAVYYEESGQGAVINCTIFYPHGGLGAGTGIVLGDNTGDNEAIETYIAGCVIQNSAAAGGIGIQINNVEHVRVVNTRIEAFQQGIVITPGGSDHSAKKLYFGNVSCFTTSTSTSLGAAVFIQPTNSSWAVEAWFDCCELDASDGGTTYNGAGVVLDPVNGSGGGGFIDQIRFTDCHVCKWNGPGLQVIGGASTTAILTNLEILGGYYSLNGASPASGLPSAGIAIGGNPSGTRISNAACNNSVYFSGGFLTPTQDYGISIAATAQNVFVRGCDLRGNLTLAVAPVSSATNVQITDCAGYNDQNATVSASAPTSSETAASQGYNGPSLAAFSSASPLIVTLGTTAFTMTYGSIPLLPYDAIKFSAAPAVFKWLGK